MADDVTMNDGSGGQVLATKDDGSRHWQKVLSGWDDVTPKVVTISNPMPFDLRTLAGVAIPTGGGVEANSLRVTIASDSTGVLSVDDNAGSLTVDSPVATPVHVSITNTSDAQVKPGDSVNNAIRCNIVAGSASGTEFNEDDAAGGGEAGPAVLGVRRDADTSPVDMDGDFHRLIFDALGRLKCNVKISELPTGAATAAKQLADGHTVVVTGVATAANQLADGHNVTVDNADGASAVAIKDGGNVITVDGTVVVTGVATAVNQLSAGHDVTSLGNIAHDAVDSGNPVKIGTKAVDVGASPTAVAAADRSDALCTRSGMLLVLGGHPNPVRDVTLVTTAVTDSLLVTVGASQRFVLTGICLQCDNENLADIDVTLGFGTSTIGTIFDRWQGLAAGGGKVEGNGGGILAVGGSDEDVRVTTTPTVVGLVVVITGYLEAI